MVKKSIYNYQIVLVKSRSETCKTQKLVSWKIWIFWDRTFVHETLELFYMMFVALVLLYNTGIILGPLPNFYGAKISEISY